MLHATCMMIPDSQTEKQRVVKGRIVTMPMVNNAALRTYLAKRIDIRLGIFITKN